MLKTVRFWLCGDGLSIEHSGISISQNLEFSNNCGKGRTFESPTGGTCEP